MLTIRLDTSIVEIKGKSATFSCTIAGLEEVLQEKEEIQKFSSVEEFGKWYFPWNFEIKDPTLIWIGNEVTSNQAGGFDESTSYSIVDKNISLKQLFSNNSDDKKKKNEDEIKSFYEAQLNNLIQKNDDVTLQISSFRLEKSLSNEPTIKVTKDTKIEGIINQFFTGSIAYYAQQLSPANQALKLSLLFTCDDFYIPENATHFIIYITIAGCSNDLSILELINQNLFKSEYDKEFLSFEILETSLDTGRCIKLIQPITAIASYKIENLSDDFIGELEGFPIDGYKMVNTEGKSFVNREPQKVTNANFIFKGNTSLIVSDISVMSNVIPEITRKFSFSYLLKELIEVLPFPEKIETDNVLQNTKSRIVALTNFYLTKIIENEYQPIYVYQNANFPENQLSAFKDKIEMRDFIKMVPHTTSYGIAMWILDPKDKAHIDYKLGEISSYNVQNEKLPTVIKNKWTELLVKLEEIVAYSKFFIYSFQFNELDKQRYDDMSKQMLFVENRFARKVTQIAVKLEKKTYLEKFIEQLALENDENILFEGITISNLLDTLITDKEWNTYFHTPENIPPPINIEVQEINTQTGADLINEISGHIILSRRSKSKAKPNKQNEPEYKEAFERWNYLNWAKVSLDNSNTYLSGKYLISAVLPKINGEQTASFHLSNESLSLIAGHDNQTGEDDVNELMNFNYSFVDENEKNPIPAAPALWYGYHYEFAGFVALNSGALPVAIRGESWNIPKEKINDKKDFTGINRSEYNHLRRVTVGLPNITIDYTNHYPAVPLLVHELVKNNAESVYDDKGSRIEQKKITAFLLCDNENQDQDQLTVTVDKPYTNFWNWYAWMGKDAKDTKIGTDPIFEKALEEELNIKQSSYTNEIENRNPNTQNKAVVEKKNIYLWERAVENNLVIKVVQIFPIPTQEITDNLTLTIDSADGESNPANFKIFIGGEKTIAFNKDKKTITIPPGFICKMTIHCKVKKTLFDKEGERMFHSWMKNHVAAKDKNDHLMEEDDYYLTNPEVFYVETAIKNKRIFKTPNPSVKEFTKTLYKAFTPQYIHNSEYGVFCTLKNEEVGFINKLFPYLSRCEVHHQVWRWNGRLFADLKASNTVNLDPDDHISTTEAMKWEAWEFANRPDITALVSNDNITASFELDKEGNATSVKALNQMIFKDQRPKNDSAKAHYFRFGLKIFNRYESIGKGYNESFQAGNYGTTWKRYLKKMLLSTEQNKLPKPAIRFAIPLTDALQVNDEGDNKVRAASMMIATYDRCFVEAGLAERFEVGIEVVENQEDNLFFLQAGEDPILSAKALPAIPNDTRLEVSPDKRIFAVFSPVGPAALTFDTNTQHPKVVGSTFILNVEDIQKVLPAGGKISAYAMVKVAIRRLLKADFVEAVSAEEYNSDWSASEWVQFLPAVDSLIPREWKEALRNSGYIGIAFDSDNSSIHIGGTMPIFDPSFEDRMDRYLVLSEMINDIGGQPVEKYVGVYKWNSKSSEINLTFVPNDKVSLDMTKKVGYARLMLVRKQKGQSSNENIWAQLFGKQSGESIKFGQIVDDPLAAMPLVTKRILVKNMIIEQIKVQCNKQSDLLGKDTLIFKLNGVEIFKVEIGSNETQSAEATDAWFVEVDMEFVVELKNTLTPNKTLVSYKVTSSDMDNRLINLKITDGCDYQIEATM